MRRSETRKCTFSLLLVRFFLLKCFSFSKVLILKVQSCKLYNNKYMVPSIQVGNTEIFVFIAVLDFKLFSRKLFFINRKDNYKLLKSKLFLKKIANFTGKLLQNYKEFECKIFKIFFKHVSDHLSVLFQSVLYL